MMNFLEATCSKHAIRDDKQIMFKEVFRKSQINIKAFVAREWVRGWVSKTKGYTTQKRSIDAPRDAMKDD